MREVGPWPPSRAGSWPRSDSACSHLPTGEGAAPGDRPDHLFCGRKLASGAEKSPNLATCRTAPVGAGDAGRLPRMSVFSRVLKAGEGKKLKALQTLVPDI